MNFANPSRSPLRPLTSQQNQGDEQMKSYINMSQKVTENQTFFRQVTSNVPVVQTVQNPLKRSMSGNIYTSQTPNQQTQQNRAQLGGPEMACFLMALEIERLLQENDRLKYRLSEIEDKLLDRNSYEQQIIDLQARLHEFQMKDVEYIQQINQYTQIINNYDIELTTWKEQYTIIDQRDKGQAKEFENLQRENREFKNQIQFLNQKVQNLSQAENKAKDFESKIQMLIQETERLNGILRQKLEELESYKIKSQRQEVKIHEYQKIESEHIRLIQLFETTQKDLEQISNAFEKQQDELNQYKGQEGIVQELQNRSILLTNEIERLNTILKEKLIALDDSKRRLQSNDQQISELKMRVQKVDQLQSETQRLNEQLQLTSQQANRANQLQNYVNNLLQDQEKYKQQCQDYQGKLVLATEEIERLNSIVQKQIIEREEQQQKLALITQQSRQFEQANQILQNENKEKNQRLENNNIQFSLKERKLVEYENRIVILSQECERLNTTYSQKQMEIEELKVNSANEIQHIRREAQMKIQEIEEWKLKARQIESISQERKIQDEKIQHYQMRVIMLSVEIERLCTIYGSLIQENQDILQELEQYKSVIDQKDEQIYGIMEKTNWLQKVNEEEKTRSQRLQQEIQKLKDQLQQTEQGALDMQSQYERMTIILRQKTTEYDEMKSRFTMIEVYKNEKEDLLQRLSQRDQKITYLTQQNDDLRQRQLIIDQVQSQLQSYKLTIQELENKITLLSSEIERLKLVLNSRTTENEQLKQRIIQLEQTLNSFKSYEENVRILSAEIDRLNNIIEQQENELKAWRLQYADSSQSTKKIQELQFTLMLAFIEIESLRNRMIEKEKEVEDVRRSSLAPYRR